MEDRKWMAQIRRGALDLCILAILSHGKRYGYDIAHALSEAEGFVIKEGTIYPLLSRMMGEGYVAAEWQPSPQGPQRKYYTLTKLGEARLAAMRAEWQRFTRDVDRLFEGSEDGS